MKYIRVAIDKDSLSKVIQDSIDTFNQHLSSKLDSVGVSYMKANDFSKANENTKFDLSSVLVSRFLLCRQTFTVGGLVKVFWPNNNSFYPGIFAYYGKIKKMLRVEYSDSKTDVHKIKIKIWHHQHPKTSNVLDGKLTFDQG